jgi:hypothetical protein
MLKYIMSANTTAIKYVADSLLLLLQAQAALYLLLQTPCSG